MTPPPRPSPEQLKASRKARRHKKREEEKAAAKLKREQRRQERRRAEAEANGEEVPAAAAADQDKPDENKDTAAAVDKSVPAPDFEVGKEAERAATAEPCVWDQDITAELQTELMQTLCRVAEHFVAAGMSLQHTRENDAVLVVVSGAIAAVSDAVMRRRAVDQPSEVCVHLMGQTREGKQLGIPGFGLSVSSFATQTETMEMHVPELNITRTAILDYFQSPAQRQLAKIFSWEDDFILKPGRPLIQYLRNVSRDIAAPITRPHTLLTDQLPEQSVLKKNYPELQCYRDITMFWKYVFRPHARTRRTGASPCPPWPYGVVFISTHRAQS